MCCAASQLKAAQAAATVDLGFHPQLLRPVGGEKAAWSEEQWEIAMDTIANAPNGLVKIYDMEMSLGKVSLELLVVCTAYCISLLGGVGHRSATPFCDLYTLHDR
jgi:hypothetical protein